MALPSLQGEGQGWGLKLPHPRILASSQAWAGIILTPPLPLPYMGGERLAHKELPYKGGERPTRKFYNF